MNSGSLEFLFHPRSIALVGITVANPEHWTRTFLDGLVEFEFEGPIYLVNPKGGEIKGLKVYPNLQDVPDTVDYVIGLVSAEVAPGLVKECAGKGVRAIQFCTAGFSETGEEGRVRLEAKLAELARKNQIRVLGPNCMGIYCPKSRLSFNPAFPKESGAVGYISQSGGNSMQLVRQGMLRGVRFSKVISYGNACDLNESDFIEHLATDVDTEIIAIYIEGLRDGRRFRQVLEKAAKEKLVVLLKGGLSEGGARAVAGHTAAIVGSEVTWSSLCKQLGIIRVDSIEELIDVLVTLSFMPLPKGRKAALIGNGGGASVLITDAFERRGIKIPQLPQEIINKLREFIPVAGNILRNPVDLSQSMSDPESVIKATDIVSQWEGIDFLVRFLRTAQLPRPELFRKQLLQVKKTFLPKSGAFPVPTAVVIDSSIVPEEAKEVFPFIQECVSSRLPVYYSFVSAANAISLVLDYYERRIDRSG
ncbi:acetate--CoA ligase family protein [Chloroflexota bacterium]